MKSLGLWILLLAASFTCKLSAEEKSSHFRDKEIKQLKSIRAKAAVDFVLASAFVAFYSSQPPDKIGNIWDANSNIGQLFLPAAISLPVSVGTIILSSLAMKSKKYETAASVLSGVEGLFLTARVGHAAYKFYEINNPNGLSFRENLAEAGEQGALLSTFLPLYTAMAGVLSVGLLQVKDSLDLKLKRQKEIPN